MRFCTSVIKQKIKIAGRSIYTHCGATKNQCKIGQWLFDNVARLSDIYLYKYHGKNFKLYRHIILLHNNVWMYIGYHEKVWCVYEYSYEKMWMVFTFMLNISINMCMKVNVMLILIDINLRIVYKYIYLYHAYYHLHHLCAWWCRCICIWICKCVCRWIWKW